MSVTAIPILSGSIAVIDTIIGTLTPIMPLTGSLSSDTRVAPTYDGEYEVTPRLYDEITLETAGKVLVNNVTVHEIPVVVSTNPQGGKTVVIG